MQAAMLTIPLLWQRAFVNEQLNSYTHFLDHLYILGCLLHRHPSQLPPLMDWALQQPPFVQQRVLYYVNLTDLYVEYDFELLAHPLRNIACTQTLTNFWHMQPHLLQDIIAEQAGLITGISLTDIPKILPVIKPI